MKLDDFKVQHMEDKKTLYAYNYPRLSVTVDLAVFSCPLNTVPQILLIRRGQSPFKNKLAFPGGFLNTDETGEQAAKREFSEETSGVLPDVCNLRFFRVMDKIDRDPRGRVMSLVYIAITHEHPFAVKGGDDAKEAKWHAVADIKLQDMAFDHGQILFDIINAGMV